MGKLFSRNKRSWRMVSDRGDQKIVSPIKGNVLLKGVGYLMNVIEL